MYSPFKKSQGRRFSAEAAMPSMPGSMGRLVVPELCGLQQQGSNQQTIITKKFSTSSQSVRHFSGGNLLQEENLFSTKANFFADSQIGPRNAMERKTSCYNDETHTSSRTDTLSRGPNRENRQLVTTGTRERRRSGQELMYTTKDDNTTQSKEQFQTSTHDEFCFANEIPKEFGQIKLNNKDFIGKPKFRFFRKSKPQQLSPAAPEQPRLEVLIEPVPKGNRTSFLTRESFFGPKMGCIHTKKSHEIHSKKPKDAVKKEKADSKATTEDPALKKLREDCLKAHNTYRAKHQSPPLKLKEDLNKMAQKWAEHLASIRKLQHSDCQLPNEQIVGENIAYKWMSSGGEFTGQEVADNWYSEVEKYDYSAGRSPGTGHFTQLVWKSSSDVGIGMDKASDGSFYVVANYLPAGNVIGTFEENVFPPE